jgi:hypothetical protein
MTLGMSLSTFTTAHVVISLVAIASGLVVLWGMLMGKRQAGMTALFLVTTILTSVTGFMFPFGSVLPSHVFGAISLVVLALAVVALYLRRLSGSWRWIYIAGAVLALYLNVFVLVVQAFLKVPAINALAPTQAEPPFAIVQGLVLLAFVVAGAIAVIKFRPAPIAPV